VDKLCPYNIGLPTRMPCESLERKELCEMNLVRLDRQGPEMMLLRKTNAGNISNYPERAIDV
jgi:hypothetical protein